jgi:hypothetical protein
VVQVTVHPVVEVVAVRHPLVAARAPVHVTLLVAAARVAGRAPRGILARDADRVLVDVIAVLVVHVTVVQVIRVVLVGDGSVPAAGPVVMCVVRVRPMVDHGRESWAPPAELQGDASVASRIASRRPRLLLQLGYRCPPSGLTLPSSVSW